MVDTEMSLSMTWLTESLILITMLVLFAMEYYSSIRLPTMPAQENILLTHVPHTRFLIIAHSSVVNCVRTCSQFTTATAREFLKYASSHPANGHSRICGSIQYILRWASGVPFQVRWTASVMQLEEIQCSVRDDAEDLSNLHLADEHLIVIPNTHIEGLLNTATLHTTYALLSASSVQFCQLNITQRCAAISQIAKEVICYSEGLGHVWSIKATFTLAAQFIQHHSDSDFFEKMLGFWITGHNAFPEGQDPDVMANFMAMVFFITNEFPATNLKIANAIRNTKGKTVGAELWSEGDNEDLHAPDSSPSRVRKTRSSSASRYTRH